MRYSFLIILLLSISGHARAEDFDLRKLYGFQWSNVELPSTMEEKRAIIDFIYSKDSLLTCEDWDSTSFENFTDYVHFLHINGDHLLDVIYSGAQCGEGILTYILLNKGNAFEIIHTNWGGVKYLHIDNNSLKSFYLIQTGCCDEIEISMSTCISFDSVNNLRFGCLENASYYSGTDLPNTLLKWPLLGRATVNRLRIRMSPKVEDFPYDENHEIHGNISEVLNKGSEGVVWAEEKDIEGRKWYFMQINGTLGWVIAKYVKIVKESEEN